MRSKEKIAEEIVLIRYYNVLFYLFFMLLANRLLITLKQILHISLYSCIAA